MLQEGLGFRVSGLGLRVVQELIHKAGASPAQSRELLRFKSLQLIAARDVAELWHLPNKLTCRLRASGSGQAPFTPPPPPPNHTHTHTHKRSSR